MIAPIGNRDRALTVFSPAQLDALITETLPKDAAHGELVLVGTTDLTGAKVVASFQKQHTSADRFWWEFKAAAAHEWNGDNQAGASVILRFKP